MCSNKQFILVNKCVPIFEKPVFNIIFKVYYNFDICYSTGCRKMRFLTSYKRLINKAALAVGCTSRRCNPQSRHQQCEFTCKLHACRIKLSLNLINFLMALVIQMLTNRRNRMLGLLL